MFRKKYKIAAGAGFLLFLFLFIYLAATGVDNNLTSEDQEYIKKILEVEEIETFSGEQTFAEEVKFISTVQDSVLQKVPHEGGVPFGQEREPADIYRHASGSCYDRSRLLEKIFRAHGLQTVHLSLYYTHEKPGPLALITPQNPSHAISKVKTREGWLAVDSNRRWLNLDENLNIVSFDKLAAQADDEISAVNWYDRYSRDHDHSITNRPFVRIYGLYSRHGLFYPPFDRIPDIHWGEFSKNITGLH